MIRDLKAAVGLACQLVFEYDPCTDEHVSEMMATYEEEDPPCDSHDLMGLVGQVMALRQAGYVFEAARSALGTTSEPTKRRRRGEW